MSEWRTRGSTSKVRVVVRPPFIRIEEVYEEGTHATHNRTAVALSLPQRPEQIERSIIAEAVMGVELVPKDPDSERSRVNIHLRKSHQSDLILNLYHLFDEEDEARRFENDVLSALTHAGNWRRR